MGEQPDPFSFLEDWEGRTHCLLASFSPCPLALRTTSLPTPQAVTISPSLAASLPRNIPVGLQACPTGGDPNLCCLHGRTPVLQGALGGWQPHKHSRQLLLLWMKLCWGRRLRQKTAVRMEGGDGRRNHLGESPEPPPPHLPTQLQKEGPWHASKGKDS